MTDLETLTLTQKRPKILRIALGAAYSFFLLNFGAALVLFFFFAPLWVTLLSSLVSIPMAIFCLYLLSMNRDPALTLTPAGFSERTETDHRAFSWSDVERFEVYTFRVKYGKTRTKIGFNFSDSFRGSNPYKKVRLSAKSQRVLTGYDWSLSNLYSQTPAQLAALLNQYRRAAEINQPPAG